MKEVSTNKIILKGDDQIEREINALSELLNTAPNQFVRLVANRMLELLIAKKEMENLDSKEKIRK